MALTLTEKAESAIAKRKIEPQLVLEIDGIETIFSVVIVSRYIRIGDTGLLIGNTWRIGGVTPIDNQENIVSFEGMGGGARIDQQLYPDKGSVSSVSSIQVTLNDHNLLATQIISPGVLVDEILGRKATIWLGFKDTAFKEEYIQAFMGIIDDVESGAGQIKINIAHSEQLKRQSLFAPVGVTIDGSLTINQTTIPLESIPATLPYPLPGPAGTYDDAVRFYIKVEDEIIRYEGISGNNLTDCTRGALATVAAVHTVGDEAITGLSMISLADTAVNCALKLMLSGVNGPYVEDVSADRFVNPTPALTVANSVFFKNKFLTRDYGVTEGDYVTITGAANSENNCSAKIIQELVELVGGTYAVIAGVAFVQEIDSAAVVSFRSRFDTLGVGLAMKPDFVDVTEHVFWDNFQLASYNYEFVFDSEIDGKNFLDSEVYKPIGAYSLPRQGRASMGYHVGPVIRGALKTLSSDNIKDPDKIRLRRTINRNFYNTIIYKFDKSTGSGNYATGVVVTDSASKSQIRVGNKALVIESAGLRRTLDGRNIADRISNRYLGRYKYAAEFFESIGVLFRDGFVLEPGDIVMLDPTGLKISNTKDGTRDKLPKVMLVTNRRIDLKTGEAVLSLTDANFDETERYGVISPSSVIVSGTTTELVIQDSFGAIFPGNEYKKWVDYVGLPLLVHSEDWTYEEEATFIGVDPSNKYKLLLDPATPLSSPPSAGYIIDVPAYPEDIDPATNALYKAAHVFLGATVAIASGVDNTHFTVAAGDVSKFRVGDGVRVRNPDYTNDSLDTAELTVASIDGVTIETSASMGFTPDNTYFAEGMGFADGSKAYLIF